MVLCGCALVLGKIFHLNHCTSTWTISANPVAVNSWGFAKQRLPFLPVIRNGEPSGYRVVMLTCFRPKPKV